MASERALNASREATLYANLDRAAEKVGIPNCCMDDVYVALISGVNRPIHKGIITFADRFVTEGLVAALATRMPLYCTGYEAWYPSLLMSREHWRALIECQGLEHLPIERKAKPRWYRLDQGDINYRIQPVDCGFVVRDPKKLEDLWSATLEIRLGLLAFWTNDTYWRPDVQLALAKKGLQIATQAAWGSRDLEDPRLQGHKVIVGTTQGASSTWETWMTVRDGTPELIGGIYHGYHPDEPFSAVPKGAVVLAHR